MQRRLSPRTAPNTRHGGTVLIVVLSLLVALTFLGFFFYSWTDQESAAARQFVEAPNTEIDPDKVIEHALVQIIVSTPAEFPQSALYTGEVTVGGNTLRLSLYSLLAHTIGAVSSNGAPLDDVAPHSGRGITVVATADNNGDLIPDAIMGNQVGIDFDGDGTFEVNGTDGAMGFQINFSGAANGGTPYMFTPGMAPLFEPDAGYTYPDLNSLFLAYDSTIVTGTGMSQTTRRIIIPSYFRPQMMLDRRGTESGFANVFTSGNANSAVQSLRPHRLHVNSDGSLRFVQIPGTQDTIQARSGDMLRQLVEFPFQVDIDDDGGTGNYNEGTGNFNEMGIFTRTPGGTDVVSNVYELDADADGDGVLDSIWLDLDYPIMDLPDGRQAVPLFYVKIIDGDGLLNANFHGHDPLFTQLSNNGTADVDNDLYEIANTLSIHASNLGMSPAEVNILPALAADPNNANYIAPADVPRATQPHRGYVADRSTNPPTDRTTDGMGQDGFTRRIIANLELHRLLHGSPEYTTDPTSGNDLVYRSPSNSDVVPGRYGEPALVKPALATPSSGVFASAGNTLFDDDGDDNNPGNNIPATSPINNYGGGRRYPDDLSGILRQDPSLAMPLLAPPLIIPASVHPLDFTGLGNYTAPGVFGSVYRNTPNGGVRSGRGKQTIAPTNPMRWLFYGRFITSTGYIPSAWQLQDLTGMADPVTGVRPWTQGGVAPDFLQSPPQPVGVSYDGLFNEADELVAAANFPTVVDAPFPPSELSGLQLTDSEWRQTADDSRLRKLMPFNFESNRIASLIRRQFTTDSRDRLEHGYQRSSLASMNRQWEFNDVNMLTGNNRFPPAFGTGITSRHESGAINPQDPFRPVVRRLLTVEESDTGNIASNRLLPGQRLDINRLLVHFDEFGNPIYRRLTPHATFDVTDNDGSPPLLHDAPPPMGNPRPMQHANLPHPPPNSSYFRLGDPVTALNPTLPAIGGFGPVPYNLVSTNKFAREVWARYDRQCLARDIYVLLYTLGGGNDMYDYSTQPHPVTGDANMNMVDDFVETIAQFAVNYVDALDQDDVITRFEYDTNLSDGWNLPNAVAFGVETQSLVFSEAMLLVAQTGTTDFNVTLHNETPDNPANHQFLYMELRNASPFPVEFRRGTWRIVREDVAGTTAAAVELHQNMTTSVVKQVAAGDNVLISCHDGTVVNGAGVMIPSDFYADIAPHPSDPTMDANLEAIVPEDPSVSLPDKNAVPIPLCDFDLAITGLAAPDDHENFRTFTMPYGAGTTLVDAGSAPMPFQLVLQRRLNTNAAGFGEVATGPADAWVEVDRITVTPRTFNLGADDRTAVQTQMQQAFSTERRQPFDEQELQNARPGNLKHTISSGPAKHDGNDSWATYANSFAPPLTGFDLWQPHFNRDFSSIYELLSVPLVPPSQLVAKLSETVGGQAKMTGWADSSMAPYQHFAAAGLFRHPNGDLNNNNTMDAGEMASQNRWYRLFEFITTAPRTHDSIRNFEMVRRTEAKINLNTIRHESVLAGLIDDPIHINVFNARPTDDLNDDGTMSPIYRNWYDQFRIARDGLDGITAQGGMLNPALRMPDGSFGFPLPGVPGSMPFRAMSYIDPQTLTLPPNVPDPNLQNTILRDHLLGPGFSLFDARATSDLQVANQTVDYHSRNRLLAKIGNNTTNRSHVFMIWLGYELFEADHLPGNRDIVRIGSRLENVPGRREFVVVDMSRLEESYNPDSGTFDFRKFIIHRRRIR